MENLSKALIGVIAALFLTGCAGTIPVTYTPQNYVRYAGASDIGKFEYAAATNGKVAPNQIENTAVGGIFFGVNVADLVQRATALELEKTGFAVGDKHPLQLSGDVLEFMADDLGYSVDWSYSIRYKIVRKSDSIVLLDKIYKADQKKTGKFGLAADFSPSVNEMILSGYDKFIKDDQVRKIYSP